MFVGIGETDDTCGEHRLGGRLARTACHQSTQAVVVGRGLNSEQGGKGSIVGVTLRACVDRGRGNTASPLPEGIIARVDFAEGFATRA